MISQTVIAELVKSVRVKEEETENGETIAPELKHIVNGCVKLEKCEPEYNSTDSTSNDGNGIKTEVNSDYILSDERISSEGEESHIDEATYLYPTAVNVTLQSNMAGGATCFFDKNGRTTQFRNMEEIQNSSSQNVSDFCECDVCGSFFSIDAQYHSNKSQSSANLCQKCRRSTSSNPSFLQEVFCSTTSSPTCKHPCSEKWPGRYNFNVQVMSGNTRSGCLYSSRLNKVYSTMNTSIPIQFKCRWGYPDLYVRAVPVFLYEVADPVVRCTHHMRPSEETNAGFPYVNHVVRCDHDMCSYERDDSSGRLSVVVPLGSPPPGSDVVPIMYRFMCSTSCLGGMNRRPIQVIFTLEGLNKEVVGRDILQVRICSCPCRDMRKEEYRNEGTSVQRKRCANNLPASLECCELCKKPKLEDEDNINYIPIYGDENMVKKAVMALRSKLIGEKLAAGKELTKEDTSNWRIFNKLICDAETSGS